MYRKSAVQCEQLPYLALLVTLLLRHIRHLKQNLLVGSSARIVVIRRHFSEKTLVLFTVYNRILGKYIAFWSIHGKNRKNF